jgi:hypothetical protein
MTNKFRLFSGLCFAAALSISSASAQMHAMLDVAVPQEFSVNNVNLPAGKYSIQELDGSGSNTVLLLRSTSGASTNVLVEPITKAQQTTASQSSVTLHQVGGSLQLDEIWFAGSEVGYRILSSGK